MADFTIRSDSVNVEQIMEQIRARIREKRGVDYTEEQIRELAAVKLEKFLDPRGVRSDLLEQFRKAQRTDQPLEVPNYSFESSTLFDSHRSIVRIIRRLLLPILKLFFNPNPLIQALNIQARVNTIHAEQGAALRASHHLYYELIHNLVVETTRLAIEVKNLKMRVESQGSRLEFNERRARALESVVAYKPSAADVTERVSVAKGEPFAPAATDRPAEAPSSGQPSQPGEGPGQRSRRRRRRRGRRSGAPASTAMRETTPPDGADVREDGGAEQAARDDFGNVGGGGAHPGESLPAAPAPEPGSAEPPSRADTPSDQRAAPESATRSGPEAGLPGTAGPDDNNTQ